MTISPQNLDDKLLLEIAKSNLQDLHILQNDHTPETILPCSVIAWKQFKCDNSNRTRIHLCIESNDDREILLQPGAPVHTIWYKTKKSKVNELSIVHAREN